MHGRQRFTVHSRVGDEDTLRYQRLVLLFKVNVKFRTDESHDSLLVSLCTDDEHLVADMEDGVTVRDAEFALMDETRHDKVAVQEIMYLQQRLTLEVLVRNLQVHLVWAPMMPKTPRG